MSYYVSEPDDEMYEIDEVLFPEITFDNSPKLIEISLDIVD